MECLENYYPTWTLYHTFMTGQLIGMDKMTVIYPVGIGENWYHCIEKYTLMLSVTEAKEACRMDQLYWELKEGNKGGIHTM